MKRKRIKITRLIFWIVLPFVIYAQNNVKINPVLKSGKWKAQWISYPNISLTDYGVFHFRKAFKLHNKPDSFIIHVSGDNRYRLFVNGNEVCKGPARGDLAHWRYESIDIAPYLKSGKNVLAAVVWNFGRYKPLAQISLKTAFIVQGNNRAEQVINTDKSWLVYKNEAYIPPAKRPPRTVVGPGDEVDGARYPYGWEEVDFDDKNWKTPIELGQGIPRGKFTFWDWGLVPRNIPFGEYRLQRFREIERTENITVRKSFLSGKSALHIPVHRKVKILLDQTFLTTAYPEILISGGKGSTIKLRYAEALVDKNGVKGNRNDTVAKTMVDFFSDTFYPDGKDNRRFQPLWFRTYRYLELTIETGTNPLVIKDFYGWFTAYPFAEKACFESDDPVLKAIWNVGWRTARLCAGETYYDCPYYEQLQYVGDTRIQALISLCVSGDDRLMRNAIEQFHDSQLPMGLTQSRFPSSEPQVIPTFSLIWIEMVHDYWMYRNDRNFVLRYLNAISNVLYWYERQIDKNGMLGPMAWWNFVDWSFGPWDSQKPLGGVPKGAIDGNSSIITLQYAHALTMAVELFKAFGYEHQAENYSRLSRSLIERTDQLCWDDKKGLLADTPQKNSFSQHANILAVLNGMFDPSENLKLLQKIIGNKDLIQTTLYFKFYLAEALKTVRFADEYLYLLGPWKDMIAIGLTTFAETPEPTRSDCHAWSASPNYHFLTLVCGIEPASPGFKTVKIEPHFGYLKYIEGKMMHPNGEIIVKLKKKDKGGLNGTIILPADLTGVFRWQGREIKLNKLEQKISF